MDTEVYAQNLAHLITNQTVVNDGAFSGSQQYVGDPYSTFTLLITVVFNTCTASGADCPTKITNLTISTPGFSVIGSTPTIPMSGTDNGTHGALESFVVVITVAPPTAGYNGELSVDCNTA